MKTRFFYPGWFLLAVVLVESSVFCPSASAQTIPAPLAPTAPNNTADQPGRISPSTAGYQMPILGSRQSPYFPPMYIPSGPSDSKSDSDSSTVFSFRTSVAGGVGFVEPNGSNRYAEYYNFVRITPIAGSLTPRSSRITPGAFLDARQIISIYGYSLDATYSTSNGVRSVIPDEDPPIVRVSDYQIRWSSLAGVLRLPVFGGYPWRTSVRVGQFSGRRPNIATVTGITHLPYAGTPTVGERQINWSGWDYRIATGIDIPVEASIPPSAGIACGGIFCIFVLPLFIPKLHKMVYGEFAYSSTTALQRSVSVLDTVRRYGLTVGYTTDVASLVAGANDGDHSASPLELIMGLGFELGFAKIAQDDALKVYPDATAFFYRLEFQLGIGYRLGPLALRLVHTSESINYSIFSKEPNFTSSSARDTFNLVLNY